VSATMLVGGSFVYNTGSLFMPILITGTKKNWQLSIYAELVRFSSLSSMWTGLKGEPLVLIVGPCDAEQHMLAFSILSWCVQCYADSQIKNGCCRKCWHAICLRYSYCSWQDFNSHSVMWVSAIAEPVVFVHG